MDVIACSKDRVVALWESTDFVYIDGVPKRVVVLQVYNIQGTFTFYIVYIDQKMHFRVTMSPNKYVSAANSDEYVAMILSELGSKGYETKRLDSGGSRWEEVLYILPFQASSSGDVSEAFAGLYSEMEENPDEFYTVVKDFLCKL